MSVDLHHPQYDLYQQKWRKCRDASGGFDCIYANFELYFPPFHPLQPERYNRVKQLSRYYDATGQTVTSLVGAAFNIPPVVKLPPSVAYLETDADGGGNDLEQVAKQTLSNVTIVGRHGLLADYPATEGENLSDQDITELGLRASIKQYPAESGINWGEENGRLAYVVLMEQQEKPANTFFQHSTEDVYRVYWMQDGGCRTQVLKKGESLDPAGGQEVKDANGVAFTEILFVFVGAMDNRASVDRPPIDGLADTNIAHFKTSCSHVENIAKQAQQTVMINPGEVDGITFMKNNGIDEGGSISLGADTAYVGGNGGGFSSISAPETNLLTTDLELLESQMQSQGAQLLDKSSGGQAMTAKQAGIEAKQQVSQMQNSVLNTSDAIRQCIGWCEQMMTRTPTGEIEYEIDTTFSDEGYDPETGNTLLAAADRGILSAGEVRPYLARIPGLELADNGEDDAAEGR